jgi:hypothetical protein
MGTIPLPETKRDMALIKDYLKKNKEGWAYSISQLGVRYARIEGDKLIPLTATRIHQILNKHGVEKNRIQRTA